MQEIVRNSPLLTEALNAIPGMVMILNTHRQIVAANHAMSQILQMTAEEVQLQLFQRSFSTKGQSGRGIGTYSMKLLSERYLGGKVEFTSREPEGTVFTLTIPKSRRVVAPPT